MVYIAHPFNGEQKNVDDVENLIVKLLYMYKDTTYYSPLNATGFFYHVFPYDEGMKHCFEALNRCDEIWFCENWQNSKGCKLEMEYALKNYIPVYFVHNDGTITEI